MTNGIWFDSKAMEEIIRIVDASEQYDAESVEVEPDGSVSACKSADKTPGCDDTRLYLGDIDEIIKAGELFV